jgi:cell division protein FtsW
MARDTSPSRRQAPGADDDRWRRWRPPTRFAAGPWTPDASGITVVTLLLVVLGLVMSFSASFVDAAEAGNPFGVFTRQATWAAIGIVAFVVAASVDHRVWRRLSWGLLAISLAGLVLVLIDGVGLERYGSTRWLGVGPLVVQPSELAKLATLLWLADVLERKRPKDRSLHAVDHLLLPAVPLLLLLALLVLMQPDLGTTILLSVIVAAILWVEGLPSRFVAILATIGLLAVATLAVVAPYRLARGTGWPNPEGDPLGGGFQLLQSRYALGSGGVFGVGLGSSRAKWNFVPNPETDFIFAILGEELGLIGATVVLALFGALLYLGLRIAYAATGFARTVAFAITAWLVGQAMINIGAVTGLLPITGVTLPLVSVGGSSLVSTLAALGILVAISRGSAAASTASPQPGNRAGTRRPSTEGLRS